MAIRSSQGGASRSAVKQIVYDRTKYGRELLVDVGWIHELKGFTRLRAHALEFHEILLFTKGKGWSYLDSHRYPVAPGTVLFTTPTSVREFKVKGMDGLCLFFPAIFLEEFFSDPLFLDRLPYFNAQEGLAAMKLPRNRAAELRRDLLAMRAELGKLRPDSAHILRARLYEVLIKLSREYAGTYRVETQRATNPLIVRYRKLLDRAGSHGHGVADYARKLAVSPGYLSSQCRHSLGRSAKRVMEERLLTEARRMLLYSDESVARIGYELGFKDASYFARFFRRISGRSPSDFRAEFRHGR